MGLHLVIGLSFLACLAVFGLLIVLMELTADYWFSEDKQLKSRESN